MKKIVLLLVVLFATVCLRAQSPVIVTKNTKTINGKKYYAHVVEKGQTVFSISRAYGVNYHDAVYKSDIDKIAIGDTVFLPTNEKPEPVRFRYYVVKQGNTLYSLSKDFQVEIDDILKLNPKIENNNIKVGEVLKIPTERTLKEKSAPQPSNTAEKPTTAPTYPAENTSTSAKSNDFSAGQKNDDTQEREAFQRQQKIFQAMAKKEQERQQKELEEQQAKEKKELEKQQKEIRQKAEKEAKAKAEQQEKELKAKEKAEKEARQKAEKEAKAKAEQQEKELKAKEKAEKEARQKAEKEAKAKAEQQEKELKAKEKAEKEAREKAEKEALDKQSKERKELDNQKKELERERKEVEKQQKELEKQRKELEKQQKETASQQTNPKAEQQEKELKAKEKAEKEARQKAEKEAKAKAEQQEKELKAKEKAEKEARQKAEKEAKAKAEQQEKELKAKEKAEKEAREKAEKEALDKQSKERKELDNQKKELERERKEVEKQQKELEKQRKELEKQQKELEKQQKETASQQTNPKAEYHPINRSNPSPDVASTGRGNTAQQSDYTYTPPQPEKQEEQPDAKPQPQPAAQQAATTQPEPAAQPVPAKLQPAPSSAPKTTAPGTSAYPELPLQTAPNIGSSVPAPNVVIRDRVSNTSINITLMMPLSLANIDEISTSKFDIEQRKRRKYKSFEFIQFYEGIMLGLESLKNEGVNVVLNVVDIPGDLPDRVAQAFATQNVAQSDFIIALVEKNAFEKAAQLAMENNVFILNPLSTRPEILDNNPYVVKLYPSYQGIVSSILSMLAKNYASPNLFLVHSNAKLEKRLFDEFQQQLSAQNKIKYTIFDWSANAKLVNMLKNTAGDNIVVDIYDQTKDKNKTQSNLVLNRLFSIKKNTPTLITLPNWASRYEDDIDFAQLQRLNYHFCSNFFLDKNNTKHKDFVTRFKEKYKTEPQGNLAALGNDIIIHFVSGIKAKGTAKFWQDPNTDRRQNMIYHFYFKRSAPEKGYENQNAYFYKLNAKYQFQPAN